MKKLLRQLGSDHGMLVVLCGLGLMFTALTWKEQHPTGAAAGLQVGNIAARSDTSLQLAVVVARDTEEDRQFSAAAEEALTAAGVEVAAVVNGEPIDLRRTMDRLLADGKQIDAIVANDVTAAWPVYDRYESLKEVPRFTPRPYYWADFLKRDNLIGVASQTAIYAIIAIGMTMVIVTAGIDLSVGSIVALAAVVTAQMVVAFGGEEASVWGVVAAVTLGLLLSGLLGTFNGLFVTGAGLPPFIVTLGMMMIASGLAFRFSAGQSINDLPDTFFWLGGRRVLGVPFPIWLMAALYLVGHLLMAKTVFGRYIYAIGGNEEAARLSGVPVKATLLSVYTISGLLAGLGGIVLASQLQSGDPKFGDAYELTVIAAVVVGGTSLMGGEGTVIGTLVGAFIIATINNGMNLINVDPYNQKVVLGAVLLFAVLVDQLKHHWK